MFYFLKVVYSECQERAIVCKDVMSKWAGLVMKLTEEAASVQLSLVSKT